MAYESICFSYGMYALDFDASSIATGQYIGVALGNATTAQGTGQGRAALVKATAGGRILGVTQSNGQINESVPVAAIGITQAKIAPTAANGSVGDILAVDANGMFVKATTGQFGVAVAHENYQPGDTTSVRLGDFGKQ